MKNISFNTSFTAFFILLFCFFVVFTDTSNAQNPGFKVKQKKGFAFDPDRLVYGGNLGFQFGDVTLIDISPLLGYKFTDKLVAGFGVSYLYYEDRRAPQVLSTSIYGGRIFGRYYFLDQFFAHTEYEILNYDSGIVDPYNYFNNSRINAHNIYVGAGYILPVSENAGLNIMLLYNLNENVESLYSNPIYRVGFTVGI